MSDFNKVKLIDIENNYTAYITFQNSRYIRRIYSNKNGEYIRFNGEKHYLADLK